MSLESEKLPIPHPPFPAEGERLLLGSIYIRHQFEVAICSDQQKLQETIESLTNRLSNVLKRTSFGRWRGGLITRQGADAAIAEADQICRDLKGDEPVAMLHDQLSGKLEDFRKRSDKDVGEQNLMRDFETNRAYYDRVLSDHLGHPGRVSFSDIIVSPDQPVSIRVVPSPAPAGTPIPPQRPVPPPPSSPALRLNRLEDAKFWVPAGQEVTVSGIRIPGGMIYVGRGLNGALGMGREPALIDPTLPVAPTGDCHARSMSYWPSYHDISPEARAAYLQWLASGKCDPDADIGYVFLYFYGLERRALSLSVPDVKNSQELSTIENEISRLLAIYEKNPSFRGYAYSLLDFMAAKKGRVPSVEELSAAPPPRKGWTLPLDLRIGLGLFAGAHRPLPAEWAFCWYQCTSGLLKSEVASSKVLPALFKLQYEERFGHGINLPAANTRITLVHKAASMSFGASSYSAAIELPDITTLSGPAESLKEVGRTCLGIISPYRRAMENSSGRENSIAVFSLLPPGLWPAEIRDGLARMRSSIAANGLAQLLRLKDLPGLSADFSGMNKGRFGMFSEQLGKLGLGIEPDTRFGGNLPDPADHVAFFVAGGLEKVQPFSTHYAVTSLLVRLAAMVAVASEGFSDAEASVVLNYLSSEMELPTAEQARLAARLSLYRVAPPNSAGLKKHIEPLNRSARETIGNFLIYVVLAGGNADPSEIRVLESLYKMLGLEQASLYSRIHKVAAQQHLPKPTPFTNDTVRPVEPKKGVLEFDTQKIAALRSESAKVSEILGKVFDDSAEEEEYTPASEKEQIEPAEQALLGLDAEHASLLQVILQRTQWSRAEMEELCADHGLMTDGAMERINEAAFDRLECAILEGEDPIDVNSDLVSKEIA